MTPSAPGMPNATKFQVSISSLTLGTLYEAVLAFSSQDRLEALWPSVCQNARWLIPSRRMAVLLDSPGGMEFVFLFEKGKSREVPHNSLARPGGPLNDALGANSARWIEQPRERISVEDDSVEQWLFDDDPALLFVLPIRAKQTTLGSLLFAMNALSDNDRAMLNTLGTIYALHVGMAYSLLRATEERSRMQEQLLMQEKLASLGSLVAGVAHEMNNPVGIIRSAADVVNLCVKKIEAMDAGTAGSAGDARYQKTLAALKTNTDVILIAGQRIASMVKSLKSFSRLEDVEHQTVDIHEGLDSTLTLLQSEFSDRIRVVREYGDLPAIPCYPGELNQAFMSLLQNAAEAIEGEGTIHIRTSKTGDAVQVEIRDSGCGIPADKLEKLFDFDFSRKGPRVKLGLGLPITYSIIQRHNGRIEVESEAGAGSCFTITLPA